MSTLKKYTGKDVYDWKVVDNRGKEIPHILGKNDVLVCERYMKFADASFYARKMNGFAVRA